MEKKFGALEETVVEANKKAQSADALKKQAENQSKEYMRLSDRYNELEVRQ